MILHSSITLVSYLGSLSLGMHETCSTIRLTSSLYTCLNCRRKRQLTQEETTDYKNVDMSANVAYGHIAMTLEAHEQTHLAETPVYASAD